jgi:hypothetical protein
MKSLPMRTLFACLVAGCVLGGLLQIRREPGSPAEVRGMRAPTDSPSAAAIDRAVERGLRWLAGHQEAGGGWTAATGHKRMDDFVVFYDEAWQREHRTGHPGISALAGLAFLASGHVPERGPYADVINRLVDYILDRTGGHDYITDSGSRMYSHSFAVLFLSQVHGMVHRRAGDVEERLREASRFIVESQNEYGAWRYSPGMREADLSVTVCQVQALRAARNVGVRVPVACIDRVVDYVKRSRIDGGWAHGAFYYKIYGRAARTKTSFAINAAAVTCLHSAGVFDRDLCRGALDHIERSYDDVSRNYPNHYYFWYGNYYAVQAMQMEGGERHERYWAKVSADIMKRQRADGSWENDVGPGDAFATAMACLILHTPLGYLPIFRH